MQMRLGEVLILDHDIEDTQGGYVVKKVALSLDDTLALGLYLLIPVGSMTFGPWWSAS